MPLRFGMLGMWHTHADGMVRQIAANPKEFSLVGFYDRDPQEAARKQKAWEPLLGKMRLFEKAEQLVSEPLDAIVVEGRVYENVALARLAVDQGKPVLLEKPAGDNLHDFARLVELAQQKHVHVQMIYLFRYMSAIQAVLERFRKGELGSIYHYRARLPKDVALYARYVEELSRYRGGIFFEMAGHVVDLMVALLGKPRQTTPFLAHHHREKPETFVDNGLAVFTYPSALASIEVPALEVAPHARRIEIFGTEGAIVVPHLGSGHLANKNVQPIEVYRRGQAAWQTIELPANPLQISDLREFAQVVAGKKKPDFTLEHDLIVQETLLQASDMLPKR